MKTALSFASFILIILVMTGCMLSVDSTKPMYGNVYKDYRYRHIDKLFIKESLEYFKTIDSAVAVTLNNAWGYYYQGSLTTAMKRFNQVWLLNPNTPDAYFGFAALTESMGRTEDPSIYYKMGYDKDTANVRSLKCLENIANCKEHLGDTIGVIKAYNSIIRLQPEHLFAFKKLGFFQMQVSNNVEAEKALLKAIELDPEDPLSYNNFGYLKYKKGAYESAVSFYNMAIELDSNYVSSLVYRGTSLLHLNQFSLAIPDFEKCVELIPDNSEFRRKLGLAKFNTRDTVGACIDLNKALSLGDKSVIPFIKKNCK